MNHSLQRTIILNDTVATLNALQQATDGIEATWITSQGVKVFKVDLSGVVDDEKRLPKYLKIRSQNGYSKSS